MLVDGLESRGSFRRAAANQGVERNPSLNSELAEVEKRDSFERTRPSNQIRNYSCLHAIDDFEDCPVINGNGTSGE
jgi:hypothetical protein